MNNGIGTGSGGGCGRDHQRAPSPRIPANPYAKRSPLVQNPYVPNSSGHQQQQQQKNGTGVSSVSSAAPPSVSGGGIPTSRAPFTSGANISDTLNRNNAPQNGQKGVAAPAAQPPNTSRVSAVKPANPYSKSKTMTSSNIRNNAQKSTSSPSSATLKRSVSMDKSDLPQSAEAAVSSETDTSANTNNEISASQACVHVNQDALAQLVAMGMAEEVARDALLRHDNDVATAAGFWGNLLSQQEKEESVDDMEVDQLDNRKPSARPVHRVTPPGNAIPEPRIKTTSSSGASVLSSRKRDTSVAAAAASSTRTASTNNTSAKRSLDFSPNASSSTKPPCKKKISDYLIRQPSFESVRVSSTTKVDQGKSKLASSPNISSSTADKHSSTVHRSPTPAKEPPKPNNSLIDPKKSYVLYFDGASKNNPGNSGAGMVLYDEEDEDNEIWSGYHYVGDMKTNNEAEYTALLKGLQCASYLGVQNLQVKGDSEVVVKQQAGIYGCKAQNLKPLYVQCFEERQKFFSFGIAHVRREYNKRADELANIARDTKSTDLGEADMFKTPPSSQQEEDQNHPTADNAMQVEPADTNDDEMEVESEKVLAAGPIDEEELCSALHSQSIRPSGSSSNDEDDDWTSELPFLVRFELVRFLLKNDIHTSEFGANLKKIFESYKGQLSLTQELVSFIYEVNADHSAHYESMLKAACLNGVNVDESNACLLSFQATLDKNGISLLPPESVGLSTRRIHRKFGSHRFLEIRCDHNVTLHDIKKQLCKKITLGGRQYGLLYSKPSDKKQVYRFFAESGTGIAHNDEISAPQVAAQCIPTDLNPNLSLAKYMKRMKLCFTVTTPTLTLKSGMLECIPDIICPTTGNVMTDGCGLVSRDALDLIYSQYINYREERERLIAGNDQMSVREIRCIYSSYQGRLGGLKGMWIVDDSLGPGVRVQYRPSQLKYDVPLTVSGLGGISTASFDDFHHTVEVKEWDTPPPAAHLSRDTVQLLEERGVPKDYFVSLARKEIDELKALRTDRELLIKRYKARTFFRDSSSLFDDDILWRMLTAGVPLDEPVMQRKVNDFVNEELKSFQEKSRFLVERSRHLRLFPDHTGLLEQDEAFVVLGDDQQYDLECHSTHIVAMRLPSYFKGDLRKLKIISKAELLQRCPDKSSFFKGVTVGLFLSTKGAKSQAEMMSGGDFDGDRAWCCWDNDIVNSLCDYPAPDTSSDAFKQPTDGYKLRPMAFNDSQKWSELIITYTWHHREDNKWLAKLCNVLNILRDHPDYGFDKTDEVARKAFLQVDNPFVKQWGSVDDEKYGRLPEPHWFSSTRGDRRIYTSKKVLGVLCNILVEAGKKQELVIEDQMNKHIQWKIERAKEKDPDEVEKMREDMKQRLDDFNQAIRFKIDSSERKDQVGKRLNNRAIASLYKRHRQEIEASYDEDELYKVFAILYEQTWFKSRYRMNRWNGEPYVFAWSLGHDYLTRIIADGEAKSLGIGLAPTVARGREQLIFGKKR